MKDKTELLDYGRLIDEAMQAIVKKALILASEHGLPGEHHFFISFLTKAPGVMISDELHKRYQEEMTIVLQHQFWGLEVEEDRFSVTLSFDNVKHNLTVPFGAVTSFADPSVKFGLQFRRFSEEEVEEAEKAPAKAAPKKNGKIQKDRVMNSGDNSNNVVALDSFRKK